MRYLASAQFLGLVGLWQKLCAGLLPARCSKEWYFATFCGVPESKFDPVTHGSLTGDAPIVNFLNGFVKPYDGMQGQQTKSAKGLPWGAHCHIMPAHAHPRCVLRMQSLPS